MFSKRETLKQPKYKSPHCISYTMAASAASMGDHIATWLVAQRWFARKKTALRERCSNELKTSATCHSHLFDEPICSVFEILDQALVPYSLLILDGCDLNHIRLLRPGQQRNSEPRFGGGEPPRTCCFEQVGTSDFFICAYFHFHHFFIKFSCIFP